MTQVLSDLFRILYYIGTIYYLLVIIYTICTWIRSLYYTKFFEILSKIVSPFNRIFSGKLIVGGAFDLGYLLGLLLFEFLLRVVYNISVMI